MTKLVSRLACVLTGAILLCTGLFFAFSAVHHWGTLWRREQVEEARKPVAPRPDKPADPNDVTDAARLRVYGVLAPHINADSADRSGPDSSPHPPAGTPSPLDRIYSAPAGEPLHLLHRQFAVRSYQSFGFVVPAHAIHPHIQGSFRTMNTGDTVPVGVMLLSQDEFNELQRHDAATSTFSTEGSAGDVDWTLAATPVVPQKYYLVFQNSANQDHPELVDADFTVSFE